MSAKKPVVLAGDGRPELLQSGDGINSTTRWSDSADSSKQALLDLSIITTGNLRTLTVPNKNGTLAMLSDTNGVPIVEFFTDVGNVGAGDDDLYSVTIAVGILDADGACVRARWSGIFNVTSCQLGVKFGGTSIFASGTISSSGTAAWTVECVVMRASSTTARCIVSLLANGASVLTAYTLLSSLDWTATHILKITGTGGMIPSDNDVVAKFGFVEKTASA